MGGFSYLVFLRVLLSMLFGLMADLVVVLHALLVLFVALGGLLVVVWRSIALVHVPSVLWAVAVEWAGWICPLTPLENKLRHLAGAQAYKGDLVEHYLIPILYPEMLTRGLQTALGAGGGRLSARSFESGALGGFGG